MQTLLTNVFSPTASSTAQLVGDPSFWLFLALMLWSIVWKGIALWKAARLSHKKWFVILLIINTAGILEIIYIYFIARKYDVETMDKISDKTEVK